MRNGEDGTMSPFILGAAALSESTVIWLANYGQRSPSAGIVILWHNILKLALSWRSAFNVLMIFRVFACECIAFWMIYLLDVLSLWEVEQHRLRPPNLD